MRIFTNCNLERLKLKRNLSGCWGEPPLHRDKNQTVRTFCREADTKLQQPLEKTLCFLVYFDAMLTDLPAVSTDISYELP